MVRNIKSVNILWNRFIYFVKNGTVYSMMNDPTDPNAFTSPKYIKGMNNIKKISMSLALQNDGTLCEFEHRAPEYGG